MEEDKRCLQALSALIIGFICIVIGVPLWWVTTDVYRANLPYAEIEELDKSELSILINCEVVLSRNVNSDKQFLQKVNNYLNTHLNDMGESFVRPAYDISVRSTIEEEEIVIDKFSPGNLIDLEKKLNFVNGNDLGKGHYRFYIVTSRFVDHHFASDKSVALGITRNVFIKSAPAEEVSLEISRTLRETLVRENDLSEIYLITKREERTKPTKDNMRSLRSSMGYDITFTLMNPQPDVLLAKWNMVDAVEKYLNPIINSLSNYANFNIKSQCLYMIGINAQTGYQDGCQCFVLPTSKLPHIINPIEPYLASYVTSNPTLNFVVYVPTKEQSPLIIFDNEGHPSPTNAFLVPRWGGLMINNIQLPNNDNSTFRKETFVTDVDHKKMFSIFLAQLKSLLGFRKVTDDAIQISRSSSQLISDWELDAWLFERTVENIGKAASTLQSLSLLLTHINNIVINDDIAQQVNMSVTSATSSLKFLSEARLEEAFADSRLALNSSEIAFFDPSLLELLYFPEDQKFAIYIPLFLPIGVPVINSIFQAIRYMKNTYFGSKTDA